MAAIRCIQVAISIGVVEIIKFGQPNLIISPHQMMRAKNQIRSGFDSSTAQLWTLYLYIAPVPEDYTDMGLITFMLWILMIIECDSLGRSCPNSTIRSLRAKRYVVFFYNFICMPIWLNITYAYFFNTQQQFTPVQLVMWQILIIHQTIATILFWVLFMMVYLYPDFIFVQITKSKWEQTQTFLHLGVLPISSDKNCLRISGEFLDGGNSEQTQAFREVGSVLV